MRTHQNVFPQRIFLQDNLTLFSCFQVMQGNDWTRKSIFYLQSHTLNTRLRFFSYKVSEFFPVRSKGKADNRKCWCSSFPPRIHFKAVHIPTHQCKWSSQHSCAASAAAPSPAPAKAAPAGSAPTLNTGLVSAQKNQISPNFFSCTTLNMINKAFKEHPVIAKLKAKFGMGLLLPTLSVGTQWGSPTIPHKAWAEIFLCLSITQPPFPEHIHTSRCSLPRRWGLSWAAVQEALAGCSTSHWDFKRAQSPWLLKGTRSAP